MKPIRLKALCFLVIVPALTLACSEPGVEEEVTSGGEMTPVESPLPDPSGWGTHVLAVAVAPDGAVWVGTYGDGIYVSRDGTGADWEHITSGDSTSISWDFVNSFAF